MDKLVGIWAKGPRSVAIEGTRDFMTVRLQMIMAVALTGSWMPGLELNRIFVFTSS